MGGEITVPICFWLYDISTRGESKSSRLSIVESEVL